MAAKTIADYAAAHQARGEAQARRTNPNTPSVLIVGAGFSGLCAAIKLREAGIPFEWFEKSDDIGGTWYLNKYPGGALFLASPSAAFPVFFYRSPFSKLKPA